MARVDDPALLRLDYATPPARRRRRPLALIATAILTVFVAMLVGSTTNVINGAVSPTYFTSVMGWQYDVWFWSVMEGWLEGFVFGILLSIVFTTAIGIISRATCELSTAMRWLGRIVLGTYALWALGGLCGVALAASLPRFFQTHFIEVPSDRSQMLRYAWVGGSIWGAYAGGPISVIVGLLFFRSWWHRTQGQQMASLE